MVLQSGGLLRTVADTGLRDVAGPYPLYVCRRWEGLAEDLDMLRGRVVSIALVTDPFAATDANRLQDTFPDLCRRYKEHYVIDLNRDGPVGGPTRHHRRQTRQGLSGTAVEIRTEPAGWLDDWLPLYDELIHRHSITGAARFPAESFVRQLAIPGMVAARATADGTTVGMQLWALSGDGATAYYHLGACSSRGYERRAAYALTASMLRWLGQMGVRRAALGAGAGVLGSSAGLDRFKAGWATRTLPVHLCGCVLDAEQYAAACRVRGTPDPTFFPAYRTP